ncbi:hypothetical protein I2H38_11430 [Microvirga sp. BT350]|uniref:Uncharacterized protein n=2 Tax=Microvirga alba TaxID=2791025 RepID=A0A931FNT0_9HYPH|nr:hypothetical protein [Microvirga alba]
MAPLAAAMAYSAFYGAWGAVFFVTFATALGCAIILGAPAYWVLRRYVRPTSIFITLTGGLLALVPGLLIAIGFWSRAIEARDRMPAGIVAAELRFLGLLFASGFVGGLSFWICAVWHNLKLSKSVNF